MRGRRAGIAAAAGLVIASVAVTFATTQARADEKTPDASQAQPAAPAPAAAPSTIAPASGMAASTAAASIDGIWMFDQKNSDDPMKIMQASRPNGGGGGGGRHRGGGGGWGGGGGMGGGMGGGGGRHGGGGFGRGGGGSPDGDAEANGGDSDNGQQQQRGPSPFARVMHPAKKVVIEMLADEVKVSEDEMEARPYAISDSLKAHQHDLVTENTSAAWKGNDLVMTQSLGQRGSLVEAYELSADGKTLTITAHREGGPSGNPNPTIKRVYTRYEGD